MCKGRVCVCKLLMIHTISLFYYNVVPLIHSFAFPGFSYPQSMLAGKQVIFCHILQYENMCLVVPCHCSAHVICLTSSLHVGILSSHIIRWKVRIAQDILRERRRDHRHIPFLTVSCYNCFTLLVIVVIVVLCQIYKLSLSDVCVYRKNIIYLA